MNYREKIKRASQTARTYGSDDPRNEQVARRKVLEERDASRGSSVPVPAPAGSGDSGIRFSLDGWGLGSLNHADFAGRDGVDVIAIQRDGQTFFRFSLTEEILEDIATGGGGGAPTTADYLVKTADAGLSAERVVTDTTTVTWDWATGGQAKANVADGSIGTVKLGVDITAAGIALLDDANAAAQRTTLGLATIASSASASDLTSGTVPTARLGSGSATASTVLYGNSTWGLISTPTFDSIAPTTTRGDLIYRNSSTNARLAIGTAAKYLRSDGTDPGWAAENDAKSITILSPSASERVPMFVARANYTITRIDCFVGSATSCAFNVYKGTDPSDTGTKVSTADLTANTVTSVTTFTSSDFSSDTITSGNAVWLRTSAISGTPSSLHVTIHMERTSVS